MRLTNDDGEPLSIAEFNDGESGKAFLQRHNETHRDTQLYTSESNILNYILEQMRLQGTRAEWDFWCLPRNECTTNSNPAPDDCDAIALVTREAVGSMNAFRPESPGLRIMNAIWSARSRVEGTAGAGSELVECLVRLPSYPGFSTSYCGFFFDIYTNDSAVNFWGRQERKFTTELGLQSPVSVHKYFNELFPVREGQPIGYAFVRKDSDDCLRAVSSDRTHYERYMNAMFDVQKGTWIPSFTTLAPPTR